ncbi:MAG: ester cyclase [Gemmatimonadota bacterium]
MQMHRFLLAAVVVVTAACSAPGDTRIRERGTRSEGQNEVLVRQVLELINDRNLDAAFEFYAPDYIYHGPGGQELRGRDGIRGLWEVFLAAFPDLHSTVDDVISEGDKLVLRWTVQGTHTGEFLGIPASNKQMSLPVTEIFRIAGGQLVEAWDQYDRLYLMEQIDAIPASTAR